MIGCRGAPLRKLVVAAFLLAQAAAAVTVWAQTAAPPGLAAGGEQMVVAAFLNSEGKGDLFVYRTPEGDFLVRTADLKGMGLVLPAAAATLLDGEPHVSLRALAGVTFSFDEIRLALAITADPRLLPGTAIDLGSRRRAALAVTAVNSGFFNYAFSHAGGSTIGSGRTDFTGEIGARLGPYLLLTDANTVHAADGSARLVRLTSSITRDDVYAQRRYVIGDFFGDSRELGNGGSFGGVSISKQYALDPYLNRSRSNTISGVAALPSELEVYVDGQKVRTERVRPGSFELRDLAGYGGARTVQVLLRDSFGRVQEINYPLYFTDQPLRQGLHEYSYSFGALRRNLGLRSTDYGPAAFAGYHRYGVSDGLTLGARAEGTRELLNAGPFATLVLGTAGVVNAAFAGSSIGGRRGASGLLGYSYQSRDWSLNGTLRWESRRYAALGDPVIVRGRKFDGSASVTYNLRDLGALSLGHSVLLGHAAQQGKAGSAADPFKIESPQNRRDTSLSYTVPILAGQANLAATLIHTKENAQSRNELFVSLNFNIGKDARVLASVQQLQDSRSASVQLNRAQPVGEGLGYNLTASHNAQADGMQLRMATSLQYNAPLAVFRADYGHLRARGPAVSSGDNSYSVSAAGGLAYVDGGLAIGRPVVDSFAVVKTGRLAGVPVTLNGLPMGKTDAQGRLFIPALSSYFENQIAIRPENMPLDYSFPVISRRVAPPARSGVVLEFAAKRVQGITGMLKFDRGGVRLPLKFQEIVLTSNGTTMALPTGRDGEFYAENLAPGSYAGSSWIDGSACGFSLLIAQSEEPVIELGDVLCVPAP